MKYSKEVIDKLLTNYRYDPATGLIYNRSKECPLTGVTSVGYTMVQFRMGKGAQIKILGHHFAWLATYGVWPELDIDHINRVRNDNRIENLREVSRSDNLKNREHKAERQCPYPNVSWHKGHSKWQARMPYKVDRKRTRLGYFESAEEAHRALQKALSN